MTKLAVPLWAFIVTIVVLIGAGGLVIWNMQAVNAELKRDLAYAELQNSQLQLAVEGCIEQVDAHLAVLIAVAEGRQKTADAIGEFLDRFSVWGGNVRRLNDEVYETAWITANERAEELRKAPVCEEP